MCARRTDQAADVWCISPSLWPGERRLTAGFHITTKNRRDFFRFSALSFGNAFFLLGGPQANPRKYPWKRDYALFQAWKEGRTGYPLVVRAFFCWREGGKW